MKFSSRSSVLGPGKPCVTVVMMLSFTVCLHGHNILCSAIMSTFMLCV
jgi:hypothetical protein